MNASLSSSIDIFPEAAGGNAQREGRFFALAFLFLGLTALASALAPSARLDRWHFTAARLAPLVVLPVWMGSAWAVRRVLTRSKPNRDPMLLPIAYLLSGWGTLTIWRLLPSFGARQTAWFLVGTVVLIQVFRRPSDLGWLRRYRYLWMTGAILLTGLTLLLGTNPSGGEPHLWLGCCGLYLQPSEVLRLLLIVFLASYFGDRLVWGHEQTFGRAEFAPLWAIGGLSVLLVIAQRDLGTGTLFVGLLAVLVYAAFGRWKALLGAIIAAAAGGLLGWFFIGIVRLRIEAWLNPWADPSGNAYQIVQSLIAIASGGLLGSGPGFGSPGFVPAAHTDFIFAAIAEEWGMIGGLALIGLVAVLVSRGLRAASRARDPFAVILAAGVSIGFGLQSVLIIGGVVRLLPLTGVTLPFVSYGGSSLLTSLVGLAFLVHVSGGHQKQSQFLPSFMNVQLGFSLAWVALAIVLGWWSLYRAPALVNRTDNPRRALAETESPRGQILDRNGKQLAETAGERGDYQRVYPDPAVAPVIGYDSTVYGQSGIELSMDAYLRGEAGYDAQKIFWHRLIQGTPPAGYDVRLTLDGGLQSLAMQALSGRVGAAVLLDPSSGHLLALASSPTFNPNRLEETWPALTSSDLSPLLNRASQGEYQPGTALAPFVFAWGLEQGGVVPDQAARDLSQPVPVDGQELRCVQPLPEGAEGTYAAALRAGCPMPFFALGQSLGSDALPAMADSFGFGRQPSLRIETAAGRVAVPATPSLVGLESVGQGNLTVSPLQLARAFSALVADGSLPALQLVEAVRPPGSAWQTVPVESQATIALSSASAESVRASLASPNGQWVEMTGYAISGSGNSQLAWYEGATTSTENPILVVIALEQADPMQARSIGRELLESAISSQP